MEAAQKSKRSPWRTAEKSAHLRSLFAGALHSDRPEVQRFSALFIVKESLKLLPHTFQSPLTKIARSLVERMCEQKDAEAMILIAKLHEGAPFDHRMQSNLIRADELFEEAINLVHSKRWPLGRASHIIVSEADALYAYGMFKLSTENEEKRAKRTRALFQAVKDHGHFEACRELESRLPRDSPERYDLLLRLAVSGHMEAAKELGDICTNIGSHPHREATREKKVSAVDSDVCWTGDKATRTSLFWPARILGSLLNNDRRRKASEDLDTDANLPPPYSTPTKWTKYLDFKAKAWYMKTLAKHSNTAEKETRDWVSGAKEDSDWFRSQMLKKYNHDDQGLHDTQYTTKVAGFKAIEWYKLASIGGYGPAMFQGANQAAQLDLSFELEWFLHHIYELFPEVKTKWPAEYNAFRERDHLIDASRVLGDDSGIDMKRLMIYGSV